MGQSLTELIQPGRGRGIIDVYKHRFLLQLLVRKEIKIRYRGSVLGLLWSYVKPLMQFSIYFVALGIFLDMQRGTTNYAIYLFAGIVLVNFFTESLGNATRSIVDNRDLIRKIYLPRELFPVSTVWVSAAHFLPQLVVLLGACFFAGWQPSALQLLAALGAFVLVAILAIGLGLLFGAANVYFRDSENIVDMILMVVTWASPVLYVWPMVERVMGPWFFLYQLNPVTVAVEVFHWAFWSPTLDPAQAQSSLPPDLLTIWFPAAFAVALLVLVIGQIVFKKLSIHFAQEL